MVLEPAKVVVHSAKAVGVEYLVIVGGVLAGKIGWRGEDTTRARTAHLDADRSTPAEAIQLVCAYLVRDYWFHRVSIETSEPSVARAAGEAGFQVVGTLRERQLGARWEDTLLLDLIEDEVVVPVGYRLEGIDVAATEMEA